MSMYLRFQHSFEFQQLGPLLSPGTPDSEFEYDCENVYQWMYVTLSHFQARFNISRDHGWSEIPDEIECLFEPDDPRLLAMVHPGPTYVIESGDDASVITELRWREIAQYIADRVGMPVDLLPGDLNVDLTDPAPTVTVMPRS